MKKVRELLDVQMEEIHKELLQAGVGGPVLSGKRASGRQREDDLPQAEQLSPATPTELIASAFQLAGYVVATLALGRSIPATHSAASSSPSDGFDVPRGHGGKSTYDRCPPM